MSGLKLAVVGSRGFSDSRRMAEILDELSPALVISGGAEGADSLAEAWARGHDVETKIFLPDPDRHRRRANYHRNRLIAEACDELIAFWDGQSTGTRHTINYARSIGKPVRVVEF